MGRAWEYKETSFKALDVDTSKGQVKMILSKFGNVDKGGDIVHPGAFKKSIMERGPQGTDEIIHLWMHDTYTPIGRYMELYEDDGEYNGLVSVTQFSKKSQTAQDILGMYEEGIIKRQSIGYIPINPDEKDGIRNLREVMLFEGSSVSIAMNEAAKVVDMKSVEDAKNYINEQRERLTKLATFARKSKGSDAMLTQIEAECLKIERSLKAIEEFWPVENHQEKAEGNFTPEDFEQLKKAIINL